MKENESFEQYLTELMVLLERSFDLSDLHDQEAKIQRVIGVYKELAHNLVPSSFRHDEALMISTLLEGIKSKIRSLSSKDQVILKEKVSS